MGRIFKRSTLVKAGEKKPKNRKRNVIVNFRVSAEEKALIDNRIELSGLSKSEFFINSCLHQQITVLGNIKTFDAIKKRMEQIDERLCGLQSADEVDWEIAESLRTILEILDNIYKE
ncbi:MAG: hypothetical protein J6A07_07185 [Firmicutes bacterium]|nr:hypothetical protein [Bacillota bacterium]